MDDQKLIQRKHLIAEKLAELQDGNGLPTLDRPQAILTALLDEVANYDSTVMCSNRAAALATAIGRLDDITYKKKLRDHELLTREAVVRFANSIVGLVSTALHGIPDRGQRLEVLSVELREAVGLMKNTQRELASLGVRPS